MAFAWVTVQDGCAELFELSDGFVLVGHEEVQM